jgi:hypothetical protein
MSKDMTRTTSGLLASWRTEGVAMLMSKTHFEQVPLELVRKIVEEQILREQAAEQARGTKQETQEKVLVEEQEQSTTSLRGFLQLEV